MMLTVLEELEEPPGKDTCKEIMGGTSVVAQCMKSPAVMATSYLGAKLSSSYSSLNQLPANGLAKASEDDPSTWAPEFM